MFRHQVVVIAKKQGWKAWGKFRLYIHSYYQCFRKGNEYAWIGWRYVERSDRVIALDFKRALPEDVIVYLEGMK